MPAPKTPPPATASVPTDFSDVIDDDMLASALQPDAADPIDLPIPDEAPEADPQMAYQPNLALLQQSHGDALIWAHEFAQLIASLTGQYIADETIAEWLQTYGKQVSQLAFRTSMFQVANMKLPVHIEGDPGLLMLQLRDEIAAGFRHPAGIA